MTQELLNATVEKDVESIYRRYLSERFINSITTSPYGCDGYLISKKEVGLRILMEFKYDLDFNNKSNVINVLMQVLYYFKKFEKNGEFLPSIILVGSKYNCFVLHHNALFNYLKEEIDWDIAPSSSAERNPSLKKKMMEDSNINPFIFNKDFCFTDVTKKIIETYTEVATLTRITEMNISKVFAIFCSSVLKDDKIDTNEKVSLFINMLANADEGYYLHPSKKDVLVTPRKQIPVKSSNYNSFFSHFERNYTPREKEHLISICDRLIEEGKRRSEGAFFTPTLWVNEAHKMIAESFGEDWKEKYIVWDCASGTGNLTRDYKFNELYCSTLLEEEKNIMEQNGINPEATIFQFDFLNDYMTKIPDSLRKAIISGKEIIFFINPPYGKASPRMGFDGTGMSDTAISRSMLSKKLGISSSQLYTQFLYRIVSLNTKGNIHLALFSPSMYKAGGSFKAFRKVFYEKFRYEDGMIFNASHFADTSDAWGIDFSIWKSGVEDRSSLLSKVKDFTGESGIEIIGSKYIYNLDNDEDASSWCVGKQKRTITYPNMSSALNIKEDTKLTLRDHIGAINLHANIQMQQRVVFLASGAIAANGHKTVTPENFRRVCALFTARKSVPQNWINDKDEYRAPYNRGEFEKHYEKWNNEAIIYSLFNSASNQSSLRNVTYKNKKWDIENQWFFMSKEEIKSLADKNKNQQVYDDLKLFGADRFVYNHIKNLTLSKEAKDVLDKARQLVIDSFQYRNSIANEKNNLNCWDAGWYQIKIILNEYMPEELKNFQKLYKVLEEKVREGVYDFGFLDI